MMVPRPDVTIVNIRIDRSVDNVNIAGYDRAGTMVPGTRKRPRRKRAGQYHHGDLRRALLEEALRTIQTEGVENLTLRSVGERLGVSRTALYRHFSDKQALLAAVGREGFRMLRLALTGAWERHGRGRSGFEAMGAAYVGFAVTHSSHYRVMFGRFVESCSKDDEFVREATAAFQVLVDALVEQQQAGLVRQDDPSMLARFIWSIVHGISMLAIDGQFRGTDERGHALTGYAIERIRDAIARRADPAAPAAGA
jgi:AcrR family transcriptional regulator